MESGKTRHIAIAGNIGAGKTTLCLKLAQHYGWEMEMESVDDNPYLEDFYYDMKKWAFPLQIYFLNSRFNQVNEIRAKRDITVIQDRTIYEDAYIFAKNLKESTYLSDRDYNTYFKLFSSMVQMLPPPDLLIYLRAGIPKLVEQITRRGRPFENAISIKYLENLNRHYEEWITNYRVGNLLILEADALDYVNNPQDFEYVIGELESTFKQFQLY